MSHQLEKLETTIKTTFSEYLKSMLGTKIIKLEDTEIKCILHCYLSGMYAALVIQEEKDNHNSHDFKNLLIRLSGSISEDMIIDWRSWGIYQDHQEPDEFGKKFNLN